MKYLVTSPVFYIFFGHLLMIGVGAGLSQNYYQLFHLCSGLMLLVLGWFVASLFNVQSKSKSSGLLAIEGFRLKRSVIWILNALLLALVLYIHLRYGLPALSDVPALARLKQREYIMIMVFLEYGGLVSVGISFLNYCLTRNKLDLCFSILAVSAISFLFSVRFLFLQACVLLIVMNFMRQGSIKVYFVSILLGAVAVIFFFVGQFYRTYGIPLDLLMEILFRRFFEVHFSIFLVSTEHNFLLPYPTYLSPFYKLFGEASYNTGFILFDLIEVGFTSTQGYAPPSLAGEVYMNFGVGPIAYVVFVILGFLLKACMLLAQRVLYGPYASLFTAFTCVVAFRLYAHTAFGALVSLVVFTTLLVVYEKVNRLLER